MKRSEKTYKVSSYKLFSVLLVKVGGEFQWCWVDQERYSYRIKEGEKLSLDRKLMGLVKTDDDGDDDYGKLWCVLSETKEKARRGCKGKPQKSAKRQRPPLFPPSSFKRLGSSSVVNRNWNCYFGFHTSLNMLLCRVSPYFILLIPYQIMIYPINTECEQSYMCQKQ